jgi:hypothetical protein
MVTAAFDLSLSALVWNSPMGSTLVKAGMALVLLGWHRKSAAHVALIAALAWSAVQAYTGAVFVAAGLLAALIVEPLVRRDWRMVGFTAAVAAVVVVLLQVPYVVYQIIHGFRDTAMGAVSGSVGQILSGNQQPEFSKSVAGLVGAFQFIYALPWQLPFAGWILLIASVVMLVRFHRDPALLSITVLPQVLAIIGYALFLDDLDHYYYLSLMPACVLTIVLAAAGALPARVERVVSIGLLVGAIALVPGRVRLAATMNRMPHYGVLVEASRRLKNRGQPLRAIRVDFVLAPTNDPEYLYQLLGGQIDRTSPWIATITSDGGIRYRNVESAR